MTASEAAERLSLGGLGSAALTELCEAGCDPNIICTLVMRLTRPGVTLQPRETSSPASFPRLTGSGLEITGGFSSVPEPPQPEPAALSMTTSIGRSSGGESDHSGSERPGFKSRDLTALRERLQRISAEIQELLEGSAARHLSPKAGSPALALTLPGRLTVYAGRVIPVLLERLAPHSRLAANSAIAEPTRDDSPTPPEPSGGREATPVEAIDDRRRPRRPLFVSHRPLDTPAALGDWDRRAVGGLQRRLIALSARLRKLHATRDGAVVEQMFPALFLLPNELDAFSTGLIQGILSMEVGPKQRPNFERLMWRLFNHVHERTEKYHDRLLSLILHEAGLTFGSSDDINEVSLRKWRSQHPSAGS